MNIFQIPMLLDGNLLRIFFLLYAFFLVPENCSHELRQFIEALFITHTETKMNTTGRLTHRGAWPSFDNSDRGAWCDKLVRRHSS